MASEFRSLFGDLGRFRVLDVSSGRFDPKTPCAHIGT